VAFSRCRDLSCRPLGILLLALASIAACGGPPGSATAASPPPPASSVAASSTTPDRAQAVCSAWVDSDAAAARVLMNADLGSGTPEQIQTIVKDFWSAQEPILTSMQPAPEPIKDDVETLLALAHQGASNGDSATFTSEGLQTADRNIDQYMLRTCGYGQISITATDDAYQGIPATIGSGAVGLTLNNRGREAHQVLIVRIDDGVTEPFSTLLDLPPDQRMQTAAALGSVEVDPGQVGTLFLRLAPGRYGVGDFLSQGSTSLDAPGSGDPHYLLGLHGEFTVA
jgi:hypothetical protein